MRSPARGTLAVGALVLAGCIFDPHARLEHADLRVVVTNVNPAAAKLSLGVKSTVDPELAFIRVTEIDARSSVELYFPTLPAGRYRMTAREFDAHDAVLRCAAYQEDVDAAESPQDKTFDMVDDVTPCVVEPADTGPALDLDAGVSPGDASGSPGDVRVLPGPDAEGTPPADAQVDPDVQDSRRPDKDMRLRKDADEEESN